MKTNYLDIQEKIKGSSNINVTPERYKEVYNFATSFVSKLIDIALSQSSSVDWNIHCSGQCIQKLCQEEYRKSLSCESNDGEINSSFPPMSITDGCNNVSWTPDLPFASLNYSDSKLSRRSSLSFSHDSLCGAHSNLDDSHLISTAVSHDTLVFSNEKESLNIGVIEPKSYIENEIYSLPLDVVQPFDGSILQPKIIKQAREAYPDCFVRANGKGKLKADITVKEKTSERIETSARFIGSNRTSLIIRGSHESNNEPSSFASENKYTDRYSASASIKENCPVKSHCKEFKASSNKFGKLNPFSSKSRRKVEICESKGKPKFRILPNNIRNSLSTIFSSRKLAKEGEDFVSAENEFITKSYEYSDSPEMQKWGKFCPIPSAPPLKNSCSNSAFSHHISKSNIKHSSSKTNHYKNQTVTNKHNLCSKNNELLFSKQANSFRSTSLLSCLGHSRNLSIDEPVSLDLNNENISPDSQHVGSVENPSTDTNKRALPPLPQSFDEFDGSKNVTLVREFEDFTACRSAKLKFNDRCDFASIIDKVKNYGWYWGPISGESAEKVLSNEPDGSFIVRDSSDYHYIFSLTFRLNGITRHVRIEHDQGNFSFGGFTRFKSQTIVDFIEKAVEHSRSGRYLFFLHRRPVLGPMRVQLLHPVSRFKHVQSLQHLCRFIIVKRVRRDYLSTLPLPQRLKDYLNSPHYYSEQVEQCMSSSKNSSELTQSEKPVRKNNLHTSFTPQPVQSSLRPEFASLRPNYPCDSRLFSNGSSGVTGMAIPRSMNYNFSCDPPAPLSLFHRREIDLSNELRRASSYSSIDSVNLSCDHAPPTSGQILNVRRRSFHGSERVNEPRKNTESIHFSEMDSTSNLPCKILNATKL